MQRGISLLIVEDNTELRELLARYLGEQYHCVTAATAEEAVAALARSYFNLILTDVILPGASGLELCQIARAKYPEAIVIIMSASPDLHYEVEATRQHAFNYLRKPFSISQLESTLEHSLRHQSLCRELSSLQSTAR